MNPLARDKQLEVITNIIEYLRYETDKGGKSVFLQIDGLVLTPAFEADLECVGLTAHQIKDGCLISWSNEIESAKNSYNAEEEYQTLINNGPKGCEETEGN